MTFSTKRLNELRKSVDFDSMTEKEGEPELEKEPLKIIPEKDKVDSRNTLIIKDKKKDNTDAPVGNGDGKVMNGDVVRSGASSPSPSVGTYESMC